MQSFCYLGSIGSACCSATCSVYAGAGAASVAQPSLRAAAVRAAAVERPFARDPLRVNPPAPIQPVEGRRQSADQWLYQHHAKESAQELQSPQMVQTCRAGIMSKHFVRKLYSMVYLTRKGWMRLVMQPGRWWTLLVSTMMIVLARCTPDMGLQPFSQGSKSSWRYAAYVGCCKSTVTAMPSCNGSRSDHLTTSFNCQYNRSQMHCAMQRLMSCQHNISVTAPDHVG